MKPEIEINNMWDGWCKCINPSKQQLKASIVLVDQNCITIKHLETRWYCYDCKKLTRIDES